MKYNAVPSSMNSIANKLRKLRKYHTYTCSGIAAWALGHSISRSHAASTPPSVRHIWNVLFYFTCIFLFRPYFGDASRLLWYVVGCAADLSIRQPFSYPSSYASPLTIIISLTPHPPSTPTHIRLPSHLLPPPLTLSHTHTRTHTLTHTLHLRILPRRRGPLRPGMD